MRLTVNRQTIGGVVIALAACAAVGFAWIAADEFSYASNHPYAYGPAKVIAWGGVAGAALAVAVGLLAAAFLRSLDE